MKIAHVGDIHWGLNYPGPAPDSRFNDISQNMDWVANRIIEEHCNLVLFAGDMFKDARVFIDRASVEIKAATAWLRKLTGVGIKVIAISGTPSHDAVSAYHILQEMQIPGVTIYTTPEIVRYIDPTQGTTISITCVPGMNRGNLVTQDEYRTLPPHAIHQIMTDKITQTCQGLLGHSNNPSILLAHLSYDMADKGFEDALMQHEPVLTKEAINGFDLVCLGHIHRPQQNGKVFYCGGPERLSFNDEEITPGFWIYTINHFNDIMADFIETPARKFVSAEWEEMFVERFINEGVKPGPGFQDAVVRLKCICPEDMAKRLDRKALERALYDAGAYYVHEIKVDVQRVDRARDQEVTGSIGPVEALARWAQQREIDPEEAAALQDMTARLLEEVAA